MMIDDARRLLLWGLEAVAWVFRGADGGQWSQAKSECLPKLAGILLFLESRKLIDGVLLDHADQVLALADGQSPAMTSENLEAEYVRLFVNHRGGADVPLCQSCYTGEGLMMGRPAVAMRTRLDCRGMRVDASLGMPADHIAIELAYLMSLIAEPRTESMMTLEDAPEVAPEVAHASSMTQDEPCDAPFGESPSRFAADVLAPWVGELRKRVVDAQASALFHLAATILVELTKCIEEEKIPFSEPSPLTTEGR